MYLCIYAYLFSYHVNLLSTKNQKKKRGRKIIVKAKKKSRLQIKYKTRNTTVIKKYNKKIKTVTLAKLKKGKYKVWVRAVLKSSGKTAYSKWTKYKTVTIK